MTVVADIIEEAFREGSLITELEHPTPTQTSRALSRLQSIVAASYGFEVGELLNDWPVDRNYWNYDSCWQYPVSNSRAILRLDSPQTIYFPFSPMNGSRMKILDIKGNLATYNLTINANGRLIEGAETLVINTNNANITWIYDAETANWGRMEGIELGSEMPLPMEFDDYFITKLAMALSPRYDSAVTPPTLERLNTYLAKIRARYRQKQEVPSELALLRLPSDYRRWYGYSTSPWVFDRGWPVW